MMIFVVDISVDESSPAPIADWSEEMNAEDSRQSGYYTDSILTGRGSRGGSGGYRPRGRGGRYPRGSGYSSNRSSGMLFICLWMSKKNWLSQLLLLYCWETCNICRDTVMQILNDDCTKLVQLAAMPSKKLTLSWIPGNGIIFINIVNPIIS